MKKATRVRWVKPARSVRQVQLGQLVPLVLQGRQARADLKGPKAPKATQAILDPTRPPHCRWHVLTEDAKRQLLPISPPLRPPHI